MTVFSTNVDGDNDSDVPLGQPVDIDGVKVWYFPSKRLRRIYWSPSMKKALEKQIPDFDILHLHSIFLWPTWAAARSARRRTDRPATDSGSPHSAWSGTRERAEG